MMSGTISAGTSLLRCRDPVAVRARASPTPAHRPTYPHSPRGLLASRGSPLNGRACWEAAPDVSEDAEPIYYLPEPRPQAAAPPSSRCASHSLRASMGSQRLHGWASTEGERRAAAAADAAAVAAARRVRRLRSTARPHAAGGRARRPCGDARRPCARAWGRRSIWSFCVDRPCSAVWCARSVRGMDVALTAIERVGIELLTTCSALACARPPPPWLGSENGRFEPYEG
jgi:hypothetical protein